MFVCEIFKYLTNVKYSKRACQLWQQHRVFIYLKNKMIFPIFRKVVGFGDMMFSLHNDNIKHNNIINNLNCWYDYWYCVNITTRLILLDIIQQQYVVDISDFAHV